MIREFNYVTNSNSLKIECFFQCKFNPVLVIYTN